MGTIYVGGSGPYATIQDGIQAAEQAGDTSIVIDAGTYIENDVLTAADNGLTISAAGPGVQIDGSMTISNASSITISGVSFQGDGSNVAVTALDSQQITVTGNTFSGTGEAVLLDGTGTSTVSGNVMVNTTGSAIEAKNGANGNVITNNVIDGDGAPETQGAIWLHGANDTTISHNQISDTSGAAISLTDFDAPGSTATQNNNDVILDNTLNDVDTQGQDSGAIYILGRSQNPDANDTVQSNFISMVGSPGAHAVGIYLDDNASGITVTQNIVQGGTNMSDPWEIHGGSNNTIAGNIFNLGIGDTDFGLFQSDEADQQPQGTFAQLENDLVTGNVFITESPSPHDPGFADLSDGIGDPSIVGNDFWSYTNAPLNVGGTGATGDSNAAYNPPAALPPTTLSDYASISGDGIDFQAIDVSQIGPDVACYCRGTRILTDRGEVAVEALAIGDRVITHTGGARPIRWIGHRHIVFNHYTDDRPLRPIRIRADAFADGQPMRDLLVSPDHAIAVAGRLIPARLLRNDASIVREDRLAAVTYFHIELDRHDILLAEGLPAESYLDTGNRGVFNNADGPITLRPDFAADTGQARREARSCLPFCADAERVAPIWRRLASRAAQLGHAVPAPATTTEAVLRLMANGRAVPPVVTAEDRHVYVLPPGTDCVRLVSRHAAPCEIHPWVEDRRQLGVAVERLVLKGPSAELVIPADHPALTAGWWAAERVGGRVWRWTTGDAAVAVPPGIAVVELHLTGQATYLLAQPATPRMIERTPGVA